MKGSVNTEELREIAEALEAMNQNQFGFASENAVTINQAADDIDRLNEGRMRLLKSRDEFAREVDKQEKVLKEKDIEINRLRAQVNLIGQIEQTHADEIRIRDEHITQLKESNRYLESELAKEAGRVAQLMAARFVTTITAEKLSEMILETMFDDSEIGVTEEFTGIGKGVALWISDPFVAKAILGASHSVDDELEPNGFVNTTVLRIVSGNWWNGAYTHKQTADHLFHASLALDAARMSRDWLAGRSEEMAHELQHLYRRIEDAKRANSPDDVLSLLNEIQIPWEVEEEPADQVLLLPAPEGKEGEPDDHVPSADDV